jgi:hypothetical protein
LPPCFQDRQDRSRALLFPGPGSPLPPGSSLDEPIYLEKGYNKNIKPQRIYPDENGIIKIRVKELERLVIHFSEGTRGLAPLPPGSTFDSKKGIFYWQLGAGFIGDYQLVFLEKDQKCAICKRIIKITILPEY